ncbi:MAG: exopolyphosphatase, partial [Eubacteriales bacterium]|nr:exopolyphosphatase [Eubacteriales bacterium]
MVHYIGLHVDYYDHNHHGFYLALNSRINGLKYEELIYCAFIIGLHRDGVLKIDPSEYIGIIGEKNYIAVQKLAMFVQISEEIC